LENTRYKVVVACVELLLHHLPGWTTKSPSMKNLSWIEAWSPHKC